MNWCSDNGKWCDIKSSPYPIISPAEDPGASGYFNSLIEKEKLRLTDFCESTSTAAATYKSRKLTVTVRHFFLENGNLAERVTIKNTSPSVACISRENFGIELPFNDEYPDATTCMTNRCNAHIWCGGNVSWVNALKMGVSDINLGLFLTKGSFVSYSQIGVFGNKRGRFVFEPETVLLKVGEEYVLEWEVFTCTGKDDFKSKIACYQNNISILAKHFTVFDGENIEFEIIPSNGAAPSVTCDEKQICVTKRDGGFFVCHRPERHGEHRFDISCQGVKTYAEFNVKIPFAELCRRRVHFIVEKQQCLDTESPLYGAYLVYDNKTKSQYFDFFCTDYNACRERMNMPLFIIRYLQLHDDEAVRRSLDLYMDFLFREFYDEATGEVFNNIGKSRDALRLYNAPGVCLIFAEMYTLTRDERYLDNIVRLCETYYGIGGEKCYSNAVAPRKVIEAFTLAGEHRAKDRKRLLELFTLHSDNIRKNATAYPKHEVNYEQTIVTPAVTIVSEVGLYKPDSTAYAEEAHSHVEVLDRFVGFAPSFHLNEISIRYWDDFWFGKSKLRGDTLPQHLSCLTARSFLAYTRLSGDTSCAERAEECIRNCLCLIDDNAQGHAAYIYPHKVNGDVAELYDEFANDQDLPLYDALGSVDLINGVFDL